MSDVPGSKIFSQKRALGYVTNHIPHVVRYIKRRKENLIVTCVGKAFHTYGCDRFSLLSVSPQHPQEITCLAADRYLIFTACENVIYAWRRGVELKHTYRGHMKPVHLILPFGPHIISVDTDNYLNVWYIKTEEMCLELNFNSDVFRITAICHPSTYINKILLGSEQGEMQLWNINSSKLIYTFTSWHSKINVLVQTTAIDVVAVGLESGGIILHNLKYDVTISKYEQDWGPVTTISFRTDGNPIMVSGSTTGDVVIWDLDEGNVMSQLLQAHCRTVTGITCLPNEPLMTTTSPDNCMKLWIFDKSDGGARLLRIREGHSYPPTFIRFYDDLGQNILSAGKDSSMRIFNLVTEIANKSLGRASYNRQASKKKGKSSNYLIMPSIVRFASGVPNNIEFDDIAAIHANNARISTWSFHYARMSEVHIVHKRFTDQLQKHKTTTACSVCFSGCMNFIFIGYSSGHVDKFNVQSGICRGSYGKPVAHSGAVRGVATDNLNKIVITGGSDQYLKFWVFKDCNKECFSCIQLDDSVSFFSYQSEGSLLAVTLDDFSIFLVDIESRSIVRKFIGHIGTVNDITISPDARWLISASMDTTIRVWDIPSGQLVDYIVVDIPCISLSFSPTAEYLATIHIDTYGIYLWTNKMLFSHISLRPISDVKIKTAIAIDTFSNLEGKEDIVEDNSENEEESFKEQIDGLITLSEMPYSRWQNILDIDLIKKRNKPKNAPKKPEAAPFFLPTLSSLELQFDFSDLKQQKGITEDKLNVFQCYTAFGKLLESSITTGDFSMAIEKIKTFSPSILNFEVTSLSPEEGGSVHILLQFLKLIEKMFVDKKDFELAQSYLGLYLKIHSIGLTEYPNIVHYLTRLQTIQESMWKSLENKLLYSLSIINHMRCDV